MKNLLVIALAIILTGCTYDTENKPDLSADKNMTVGEISCEVTTKNSSDMTSPTVPSTKSAADITVFSGTQTTTAVSTEKKKDNILNEEESDDSETPTVLIHSQETESATIANVTLTKVTTKITEAVTSTKTTEAHTESITERPASPKIILEHDGTDYGKAKSVYEYMLQNGSGSCVNYSCQTYELCIEIGLPCCLVWTDTGIYGHVANVVCVDGIWYVLDTQGGYFLDYNYCFTEVIDIEGNYIADGDLISDYSYDELN